MKANAPEKIYIGVVPSDLGNNRYTTVGKDFPDAEEYAHVDAFIEKALKWIDNTFHGASIDSSCGELVDVVMSEESVYKDDLIEDFKNYMKEG